MPLADPNCAVCRIWTEGDPACLLHGGFFEEGQACPVCGSDLVVICQKGAAYICFHCEELEEAEEAGFEPA